MTPIYKLRAEALHWRSVDDEIVALDDRRGEYLSANRTGALLWPALADGATFATLTLRLLAIPGAERVTVEADVRAFLDTLRSRDLLDVEDVGGQH